MRRVAWASIILIPVLLVVGIKSRMATESRTSPPQGDQQQRPPSPLTQAEQGDLTKLTGQALWWIVTWVSQPTNCPQGDETKVVDLTELYKHHEGQQVEATLVISDADLSVYLPPFHLWLGFRRFHNLGLSPPTVGYFCENSYQEHIAADRRRAEETRAIREEIVRRAQADPQLAEILKQLKEKESEVSGAKMHREEPLSYKVPPLLEAPTKPELSWSEEKKYLYERVVATVRAEAESLCCVAGKTVKITVPDFLPGDPEIFVLVEAPKPYGKSVQWIKFNRDLSSGEYDAYHAKTHELWPSEANAPAYLLRLRDLIKRKQVKQEEMLCPKKRAR